MSVNAQERLLLGLTLALAPLRAAAQSAFHMRELAGTIGWDLDRIAGFPADELANRMAVFVDAADELIGHAQDPPDTLLELVEALEAAEQAYLALHGLPELLAGDDRPSQFEEFGRDLIEAATLSYLELSRPVAYHLAVLLTLIDPPNPRALTPAVFDGAGNLVRFPHTRPRLRLDRLDELLEDPEATLRAEYAGPNGIATEADARATADKLFPRVAALIGVLGGNAVYGVKPLYGIDLGDPANLAGGMLTWWVTPGTSGVTVGTTLSFSPAERGDLGLVISPFGAVELKESLDRWQLTAELTAGVDAVAVGPQGVKLLLTPGSSAARFAARVGAVRLGEADEGATLVGSTTGTRLELPQVGLLGTLVLAETGQEVRVALEIPGAALVVSPGEGDSFLREILPPEGLRATFDLAVEWSSRTGLAFRGSAALEAELAVRAALGPLAVESVYLSLRAAQNRIAGILAVAASVRMGPVRALVERTGIETTVEFPEAGGNLGPADLSLGFKAPDGIGVVVDAGPVTGGGFLRLEPELGRYSGAVELEVYGVGVKAIGLLETRIPGGSPAYSFLLIISTQFTPIPLGLGFTLNGVGGIAGIHRRVDVEAMRTGLREGSLDHVLFVEDPIANATRIVSDLQTLFPPAAGRYVFGPTAIIGWGTPMLLEGELGILLELPDPARILLLGQFHVALPRKDRALVVLNLDVLGEIDPERGRVALDGRLRNSRVVSFPVEGDFAVRLGAGDGGPNFVLAVGGFHPDYKPPPGFPDLKRVTVPIGIDDNPRITLEGYLAVTSNTLQIGAAASVYAKKGWFNITGEISFDALFVFSPFSFVTDFSGKVTLRKGESDLASIKLEATLSGPTPWHASGEACLEIRWLPDICVGFSATFGREERIEPPRVDPWPLLRAAVESRESWSSAPAPGASRGATLGGGADAAGDLLLDPGAGVTLLQTVVPLNRRITKFGPAPPPEGSDRFDVGPVTSGPTALGGSPVQDFFAPAQFEQLTEDQQLSVPSFERMDAGITVAAAVAGHGAVVGAPVTYETKIIDPSFPPRRGLPHFFTRAAQLALADAGAVARAPERNSGPQKFAPPAATAPLVQLAPERYVVASTLDLAAQATIVAPTGKTAALQALADHVRAHPDDDGVLDVVAVDELARV